MRVKAYWKEEGEKAEFIEEYGVNIDKITLSECLNLYCMMGVRTVIENGKVVALVKEA